MTDGEASKRPLPGMTTEGRLAGKRVWIIGINYAPDQIGIAPYTTQLAEYLVGRGVNVSVTTGIPYYPGYRIERADRWTLSRRERINDVAVRRLRHSVPRQMTAVRRALHEMTFLGHVLARRPPFRPDVIVGVTPALSGGVAAAWESKRLGVPLVLVVQDLVGPGALQSGISGGRSFARGAGDLEGWAMRHATGVVVLHDRFRSYGLEQGLQDSSIHVVRNWSYAVPCNVPSARARADLGWPDDRPVVLYAGNMGLKMGLENVIEAARLARDRNERILFVLLGDGSQRERLVHDAQGIETIRFESSRFGADFANALGAADVLLINERTSVTHMSLPSKLAYYFTSGRPVLAAVSPGGTTALEVERARAGVVIPPADPGQLLDHALELARDKDRCLQMGAAGCEYAAAAYDRDRILARYEQIIADAAAGVHAPA